MSQREIPAIKAALSAWRKLRRDKENVADVRDIVLPWEQREPYTSVMAESIAWSLEKIAALDERLRKEAKK
jgi:hypothetical protein